MKMFRDYDHYCEHTIIVSDELISTSEMDGFTTTMTIEGSTFNIKYTDEWNNYILLF
jgi:hypothetical protein